MKSLLHFSEAHSIISAINEVLDIDDVNRVSFTHRGDFGHAAFSFAHRSDSLMEASLQGRGEYKGNSCEFEVNTLPAGAVKVAAENVGRNLDFEAFLSTSQYTTKQIMSPFKVDCLASANATMHFPAIDLMFFIGAKKDKAISMLTTFKSPHISASFGSLITEKTNSLEIAAMSQFGPFASIRADIKLKAFQGFQIGWMYRTPSLTGFTKLEFVKRIWKGGFVRYLDNQTRIALTSEIRKDSAKVDIGVAVTKIAELKAKLSIDGTTEMQVRFRPNSIVDLTFKSKTSAKTKFEPVNFGFSMNVDIPERFWRHLTLD